jgi:hypothetical protein
VLNLGALNDGGVATALQFSGNGTINLNATGNLSGATTVSINAGATVKINANAALGTNGVAVTNNGLFVVAANQTIGGISGAGALTVGNGTTSNTLTFAPNTPANSVGSLSILGSSTLDIGNHQLFINYGSGADPMSTIYGYLQRGFNGGGWNGPGIISSTSQTPTNGFRYGVGWADGNDGTQAVAGLTSGQIELKYTLLGDANLDGTVNGSDFSILAANFGLGHANWDQGNFLISSSVNGSDFSALAANFGQGDSGADGLVTPADIAALDAFAIANGLPVPTIGAVPEPASIGLLVLAASSALGRRRRKFM